MRACKLTKVAAVLIAFSLVLNLSGCFLFGGEDEELPDWRVKPTAIVNAELALAHLEWYFELLEFPADSFFAEADAAEITAVTDSRSRIVGFAVEVCQPLWVDDVSFFLITRDERIFYNLRGQEARDGVFLVHRFEEGALTLAELSEELSTPSSLRS
jgi:hypothetical protein